MPDLGKNILYRTLVEQACHSHYISNNLPKISRTTQTIRTNRWIKIFN